MTALTRRTTKTACPRQTTFNIWPASSFDASPSTGAPKALARALGFHDAMKGIAANAAPITPVPTVAAVSKRRRLWSTSSLMRLPSKIVDKSSRKPLWRQCFPKNIGSALYTVTWAPLKPRGAILIAGHSRPREFFDQGGRGRSGRGISRGLVEPDVVGCAHCPYAADGRDRFDRGAERLARCSRLAHGARLGLRA